MGTLHHGELVTLTTAPCMTLLRLKWHIRRLGVTSSPVAPSSGTLTICTINFVVTDLTAAHREFAIFGFGKPDMTTAALPVKQGQSTHPGVI